MALSNWTVAKSDTELSASLDLVTPIVGGGSLSLKNNAAPGTDDGIMMTPASPVASGFTRGKIRTLCRIDTSATASGQGLGIFFMADQADLTLGAGSCYALVWRTATTNGAISQLHIANYTAGFDDPTSYTLASESFAQVVAGTVLAMEVEWNLDVIGLGGLRIIARRGSLTDELTDFSDMTEVVTHLDASPLLTSVGEGIFMINNASGDMDVSFDQTKIIEHL